MRSEVKPLNSVTQQPLPQKSDIWPLTFWS